MERTACVTGADRGLGLAIVQELVANGFIVFAGKYMKKWNLLEDEQRRHPDRIIVVDIDISSDASVQKAAQIITSRTDSIDILVNNAGIPNGAKGKGGIFDELDFDDILHVVNVNAIGMLRMTQALIKPIMASYHKLIVSISSEAGSIGTCWRYNGFGYCMSKAALNMASAIVHNSLHRQFNGQVINIHPGGMATHFGSTRGAEDEMLPPVERKSFITPEHSAKRIVALMLDQERFKSDHPAFLSYAGDRIPW